jgi:2-oxoisovalerate dehydrogenase E2 component (dihydrolipoyl transacylase)
MSRFRMKLPDVGEGVAEAELVSWLVEVGEAVTPETTVAEVLTDKSTVEISSPVSGTVVDLHGEPGDVLAVGSDLIEIDTGTDTDTDEPEPEPPDPGPNAAEPVRRDPQQVAAGAGGTTRALASPAVRARAAELQIELGSVRGTGPDGQVVHADLDRLLTSGTTNARQVASGEGRVEPVRGVRRRIADRLSDAWSEIPHITYVDAVDATELERLRAELNARSDDESTRLTMLPFLARAIVIAAREQPRLNAHYDHENEELTVFDAVHLGIATQTDDGLRVPVVRHAEGRDLSAIAAEIGRVSDLARSGGAARDVLSGSTITITSLGALGGLVTTPILNAPEVAIVGVNKMEVRPVWRGNAFEPRRVFNLSSSFDHRIVDGWDAAVFVQRIKALLETPALLFLDA